MYLIKCHSINCWHGVVIHPTIPSPDNHNHTLNHNEKGGRECEQYVELSHIAHQASSQML